MGLAVDKGTGPDADADADANAAGVTAMDAAPGMGLCAAPEVATAPAVLEPTFVPVVNLVVCEDVTGSMDVAMVVVVDVVLSWRSSGTGSDVPRADVVLHANDPASYCTTPSQSLQKGSLR